MNVEIIETGTLQREVRIAVDAERVEEESRAAFQAMRRRVKVKGFRPGKVPRREIERRYGKSVRRDVVQTLIRKTIAQALQREDLQSVIYVSPPEVADDAGRGGFSFHFNAEVRPEVNPTGYLGLQIAIDPVDVTDAEIDTEFEKLRRKHAMIEPVTDRDEVAKNDTIAVSYRAAEGEEGAEFLETSETVVDLEHDAFAQGFVDGVIGMTVGDRKTIHVDFSPTHPVTKRLGRHHVDLDVTVHAIKRRVLPDVDDDFAEEAADVETVAELRERIRKELAAGKESQSRRQQREKLEDALLKTADFELPPVFVSSQIEDALADQLRYLDQSQLSPEDLGTSTTSMRERAREAVERRVRVEFILRAIAERENVAVSEMEVGQRVQQVIATGGVNAAQIRRHYEDRTNRNALRERLLIDKTLDFLLAQATISTDGDGSSEPSEDPQPKDSEA